MRPSGSYKLVDENGTESVRNGKTLKPVFAKKVPKMKDLTEAKTKPVTAAAKTKPAGIRKKTPNSILLEELVRERDPAELEAELTKQLNNVKDGRKLDNTVDISRSKLLWNNAVENAATRIREGKKKRVSFDEGSKKEDGGRIARRRSERLRKEKRTKNIEKFVRSLKPSKEMRWGPFVFIKDENGKGLWYEDEVPAEEDGKMKRKP